MVREVQALQLKSGQVTVLVKGCQESPVTLTEGVMDDLEPATTRSTSPSGGAQSDGTFGIRRVSSGRTHTFGRTIAAANALISGDVHGLLDAIGRAIGRLG